MSWSFSDVFPTLSRCGSYCDVSGQLVPRQQCGPRQICCGTLRKRTCCQASDEPTDSIVKELWRDVTCASINDVTGHEQRHKDDDDDDYNKYPSTTTQAWTGTEFSGVQWWWFVVPLITLACLMMTLAICYFIRYHEMCQQSRSAYEARNRAMTNSSSNSQTPCQRDFDPSSDCAFAPPPYDSLPKDPPTYDEICTSVNESFWIDENEQVPPPPARRRTTDPPRDDQQQQQQQSNVTRSTEPPYIEVIY